jgi:hypothetical protein
MNEIEKIAIVMDTMKSVIDPKYFNITELSKIDFIFSNSRISMENLESGNILLINFSSCIKGSVTKETISLIFIFAKACVCEAINGMKKDKNRYRINIIVPRAADTHSQRGNFRFLILILPRNSTIGLPTRANTAEIMRYATMFLKYHARKSAIMIPATINKFW